LDGSCGRGSRGEDGGHAQILNILMPHPQQLLDIVPEMPGECLSVSLILNILDRPFYWIIRYGIEA